MKQILYFLLLILFFLDTFLFLILIKNIETKEIVTSSTNKIVANNPYYSMPKDKIYIIKSGDIDNLIFPKIIIKTNINGPAKKIGQNIYLPLIIDTAKNKLKLQINISEDVLKLIPVALTHKGVINDNLEFKYMKYVELLTYLKISYPVYIALPYDEGIDNFNKSLKCNSVCKTMIKKYKQSSLLSKKILEYINNPPFIKTSLTIDTYSFLILYNEK